MIQELEKFCLEILFLKILTYLISLTNLVFRQHQALFYGLFVA